MVSAGASASLIMPPERSLAAFHGAKPSTFMTNDCKKKKDRYPMPNVDQRLAVLFSLSEALRACRGPRRPPEGLPQCSGRGRAGGAEAEEQEQDEECTVCWKEFIKSAQEGLRDYAEQRKEVMQRLLDIDGQPEGNGKRSKRR